MPTTAEKTETEQDNLVALRKPESQDGAAVHDLIGQCGPLDENSLYCNLLQCTHFADTCVVAEMDGELVGFVAAYVPPRQPNVLFLWQIAVHDKARGKHLAARMLDEIIKREECDDVQFIETSVTPDNEAAWNMFRRFAFDRNIPTEEFILFDSRIHFCGEHKDEHLLRMGPFNRDEA
jgi:L-2,4-diaminobutyric acid acetyltransferase